MRSLYAMVVVNALPSRLTSSGLYAPSRVPPMTVSELAS